MAWPVISDGLQRFSYREGKITWRVKILRARGVAPPPSAKPAVRLPKGWWRYTAAVPASVFCCYRVLTGEELVVFVFFVEFDAEGFEKLQILIADFKFRISA